jgi:hypothetical protein
LAGLGRQSRSDARKNMTGRAVTTGQKSGPMAASIADAMSLRSTFATKTLAYRAIPAVVALSAFLAVSAIYLLGHNDAYMTVLRFWGIFPFRFPFVDISYSLAAWDCTRLGIDVVEQDPCDVLGRAYTYSPLWMAGSFIPLGTGATAKVGWVLGLLFILSLALLPPVRRPWELVLVVLAANSTMVVFAVERANPDIILFMMALLAGFLSSGFLPARLLAYLTALFAALLKYYPLTLLILSFRERVAVFLANSLAMTGLIALFLVAYLPDVERGWPLIPSGSYFNDLFAAKNLPFGLDELIFGLAGGSANTLSFRLVGAALYGVLVLNVARICRRLLTRTALRSTFSRIVGYERIFLVVGSALIVGCFFAGQSIGYRGIFLLFVLPGLLAMARIATDSASQRLSHATAIVVVLLMWEECFRNGLAAIFARLDIPPLSDTLIQFTLWLVRELAWWWIVSVMTACLLSFVAESETFRGFTHLSKRYLSSPRAG